MARFPLVLAARLRTSQSGREEVDPATAPLTVYTLTITLKITFFIAIFNILITWCHVIRTPQLNALYISKLVQYSNLMRRICITMQIYEP